MNKIMLQRGVLLSRDNRYVIFETDSMRLFNVDIDRKNSLSDIRNILDKNPSNSVTHTSTPSFSLPLRQAILPIVLHTSELQRLESKPSIGRLTLNISNACNLWCSYCYADHGFYHSPQSLMPPQTVQDILRRIFNLYSGMSIIHFFGGEPLLNIKAIESAGQFIDDALEKRLLTTRPAFVATTNGTISSAKALSTLRRWEMELTVSWDGPKQVHDQARPTATNASSFDMLRRSLDRFAKNRIPFTIECTLSAAHRRAGISVIDLMNFFWKETGQKIIHIAPASTPTPGKIAKQDGIFRLTTEEEAREHVPLKEIIDQYREAARLSVHNLLSGEGPILEFANRVIEQLLLRKKSSHYCPAFFSQLSIAADGSAYPCFMFIGDKSFQFGNILQDSFPTSQSQSVMHKYFSEFGLDPVGTQAWYRDLFGGCVAGDHISTGGFTQKYLEPLHEAIIEECIFELAVNASNFSAESVEVIQ